MLNEIRQKVIDSFKSNDGYTFSNEIPFKYNNFIDGMSWLSMVCGACRMAGDDEIYDLSRRWLRILHDVGKDARNFAPLQVTNSWQLSKSFATLWYKEKPQAFAGGCASLWAIDKGAGIYYPENKNSIYRQAKLFCKIAPLFGYAIRWIPKLRQHINSIMFAHMLLNKIPPNSMRFLTEDNMVYSYLYRLPCRVLYPDNTGIWSAKNYPGDDNKKDKEYSPICNLVGIYLQNSLDMTE